MHGVRTTLPFAQLTMQIYFFFGLKQVFCKFEVFAILLSGTTKTKNKSVKQSWPTNTARKS